jgi:hypothetical protein
MSFYLKPESITDEIINTLQYTGKRDLDEFTLRRYFHKLNEIKDKRFLTEKELVAFGLVLFNIGKHEDFITFYNEAKERHPESLNIHAHDTLGRLHISLYKKQDLKDFDLYDYWFDKRYNPEGEKLEFFHLGDEIVIFGKAYSLGKEMVIDVSLYPDKSVIIECGPFKIKRHYDETKRNAFRFGLTVVFEYIEKIRRDTAREEEAAYMEELLGTESHDELVDLFRRTINDETRRVIEDTDAGIDVVTLEEDEDLMAYLDSNV